MFPTGLTNGASCAVSASGAQNCNVTNGPGTMGATDISNVTVTCTSVVRSANLSSAQENPPNRSTATVPAGAVLADARYAALPAVAPVHTGATGVSGPANVATLTAATGLFVAPSASTWSARGATDLTAGNSYCNVHSTTNPGGEIRGQIAVQQQRGRCVFSRCRRCRQCRPQTRGPEPEHRRAPSRRWNCGSTGWAGCRGWAVPSTGWVQPARAGH